VTSSGATGYLYDAGWALERKRLQAIEALFDLTTQRVLERVGLADGWRCLEVGCGAGSIARWLAERVGSGGYVLATDLDPRFVSASSRGNLEVLRHDLARDAFPEGAAFDLVHTRAVLAHLADWGPALRRLISVTRPGGWLVVEDVDLLGMGALAEPYASRSMDGALYARLIAAYCELAARSGAALALGPRLPEALREAGLGELGAELHAPLLRGGSELDCMRLTFEYFRERLADAGLIDAEDVDHFLELTHDPTFSYLPPLMVTAWGRRPAA
jgi:SAM-dependent methyltransferase